VVALAAAALYLRLSQHHSALLYPDGYQYLLMARGISEHFQPTTVLGPGGDTFAPSADAALKPLFPLLVAGVHTLGLSWLDAARLVTVVAGAFTVIAVTLLVSKLSGSTLAGLAAGLLFLSSPSVGFWSGFSGPDPLAQALALAAALAFVHRRPRVGGILTGLAIAARPEMVIVAAVAAVASLRTEEARRDLARAAPAAIVTGSLVFTLLRAPITIQDWRLVWLSPLVLAIVGLLVFVPSALLRWAAITALGAVVLLVHTWSGPEGVWRDDWPLLLVAAAGFLVLMQDERRQAIACFGFAVVLLLGAVYVLKNPALPRYFSLLLPVAAVLAGVATTSLPRWAMPLGFGAIALAAGTGFLRPEQGNRDYDMFSLVAQRVAPALDSTPLITAAPDAYGFWLPTKGVRAMQPGARGTVLLDAAQRLYEPGLTAKGRVIARVTEEIAFSRPNGEIDAGPAVLVAGRVVVAHRRGLTVRPR
jgi:4-amino-4-deoxy-L-arabinose transferase-like glycosyltransferase